MPSSILDVDFDAEGFAVVSAAGLVTDVFVTNRGSGYQSPPWADISSGGGSIATGTAEIASGMGDDDAWWVLCRNHYRLIHSEYYYFRMA